MQVQSLGWEEPLEKEMATHSSILAWEIPWPEEPGNPLQYFCLGNPMARGAWRATVQQGCKEVDTTKQLSIHTPAACWTLVC